MRTIEFGLYQLVSGDGPKFMCRPMVDRHERLIFTGETAEDVETRAREWARKNFGPKPGPDRAPKQEAASQADIFS